MQVKTFDLEVKDAKENISQANQAEKVRQSYLDNETELAVIFSKALEYLGAYISENEIAGMIGKYHEYRSESGYTHDQAVEAAIWNSQKWSRNGLETIQTAVQKTLDYDPSSRVAQIKFRQNHRFLFVLAYILLCVGIFAFLRALMGTFASDRFNLFFLPSWITLVYVLYTAKYLKRPRY